MLPCFVKVSPFWKPGSTRVGNIPKTWKWSYFQLKMPTIVTAALVKACEEHDKDTARFFCPILQQTYVSVLKFELCVLLLYNATAQRQVHIFAT